MSPRDLSPELRERARQLAADAPPLTPAQVDALGRLFRKQPTQKESIPDAA